MATLLSPTATSLKQKLSGYICFSPSRPSSQNHLFSLPTQSKKHPLKCNAIFSGISDEFIQNTLHVDQSSSLYPIIKSGYSEFLKVSDGLPDMERWGVYVFGGIIWLYLTARPGVLIGAIDAYILAPLQLGFDSLTGKRSLKRSDFLIGDKLGEGSFGVVYSGVVVPKNVTVEERVRKSGSRRRQLEKDARFKDKVILKQVTILTDPSNLFSSMYTIASHSVFKVISVLRLVKAKYSQNLFVKTKHRFLSVFKIVQ